MGTGDNVFRFREPIGESDMAKKRAKKTKKVAKKAKRTRKAKKTTKRRRK